MDKLAAYLQDIKEVYPDLAITHVELYTGGGQFNDILIANQDLIFRFPRSLEIAQEYPLKIKLLACLADQLPLPIPDPIFTSPAGAAWKHTFMGYRRIPGEPFYPQALDSLVDPAAHRAVANQIAGFLKALHAIPIDKLPSDLPLVDGAQEWADLYQGIKESLIPHMRPDARHEVARHFEDYLARAGCFAFTPALRHGDFGGSNILYDPDSSRISGVIDFESLGLGDPAVDAAGLMGYSEAFFILCRETYPALEGMRERAAFYRGTFALQEAYYGLRDADQAAFQHGLRDFI